MSSQAQIYGSGNPGLKVMGSESNKTLRDGRMWREGENYWILLHCNICINRLITPSRCLRPGDLVYTVAWILNPPSKLCAYPRMQWGSVKLSTWPPRCSSLTCLHALNKSGSWFLICKLRCLGWLYFRVSPTLLPASVAVMLPDEAVAPGNPTELGVGKFPRTDGDPPLLGHARGQLMVG